MGEALCSIWNTTKIRNPKIDHSDYIHNTLSELHIYPNIFIFFVNLACQAAPNS